MEPVLVGGIPFLLLHILERPETSSDVIEYAVQHNFDAVLVQRFADGGEVLVGAETAVHAAEIAGVVAVAVGFKNRGEVYGIAAERRDMLRPVANLADARNGHAVVYARRTAEADGIDLIKYAFVCPHEKHSFTAGGILSIIKMNYKCKHFMIKIMQSGDRMRKISYAAGLGICLLLCACSQKKPIRLLADAEIVSADSQNQTITVRDA